MKYLIPIFLIVFILIPTLTQAAAMGVSDKIENLLSFVADILKMIGILVAVIVFIISGIMYMTASGDEGKLTTAKKTLFWGIVGAALVFAAGWIVVAIESLLSAAGVD